MFYTPKPRQFHYTPRFYDPEKERWEALKQKYADEHKMESDQCSVASDQCSVTNDQCSVASDQCSVASDQCSVASDDRDLAYFQKRVRELDREEKHKGLTWKDAFRKREMPKFNYQPRFSRLQDGENLGTGEHIAEFKKRGVKIKRRFDVTDPDYMKPVPATRIMLYTLLVCMLLYWILF